jgi:hypothetical protein
MVLIYSNSVGGVAVEVSLAVKAQYVRVKLGGVALVVKQQGLRNLVRFAWAMDRTYPATTLGGVSVERSVNAATQEIRIQAGNADVRATTKKDRKELERFGWAIVSGATRGLLGPRKVAKKTATKKAAK